MRPSPAREYDIVVCTFGDAARPSEYLRQVLRKALFPLEQTLTGSDLMSDVSFSSVAEPLLVLWQLQVTKIECSTKESRISRAQESRRNPR